MLVVALLPAPFGVVVPGQNREESGVSTSSMRISSSPASPNSIFVSAMMMPAAAAIPSARLYTARLAAMIRSVSSLPMRRAISSIEMGRSCSPSGAFVEGVKMGSGSLEDSLSPAGRRIPETGLPLL
jgi:hypothetical protein